MTPREQAIQAVTGSLADPNDDAFDLVLSIEAGELAIKAIESSGLQIIRRPEPKERPDEPGWWWVRFGGDAAPTIAVEVIMQHRRLVMLMRSGHGIAWSEPPDSPLVHWAVGPLDPPTGSK